jgi:hypothetical protein
LFSYANTDKYRVIIYFSANYKFRIIDKPEPHQHCSFVTLSCNSKKHSWRISSIFKPVYRSLIIFNNKTKELSQRDKIQTIGCHKGWRVGHVTIIYSNRVICNRLSLSAS